MKVRDLLVALRFKVDTASSSAVESTINRVKNSLRLVGTTAERNITQVGVAASEAGNIAEEAGQRAAASISEIGSSAAESQNHVETLRGYLNSLLAFAGLSITVGGIISMVDEWKTIEGQVNNVTKSQKESVAVQKELYNIASRTRQKYEGTAELFTSVARNAAELGKSQSEVLALTEDVSNAMLLGGGSAASQQAALVQLGQALGSGTLRGDELNSIMEQAPRLAKVIAEGMGTTIGNLRQMGQEGKLTAKDVFDAIRSQSAKLKGELGNTPWTVQQALNRIQNAVGRLFYEIEKKHGIVKRIANGFSDIADYIEKINIDKLVLGFQLLTIYASAFFIASKWGAIIRGAEMLIGVIKGLRNAYLAAKGAQVTFMFAGAPMLLMVAKLMLIAAAITLVILALEDFYTWVQGGDSILGDLFGPWAEMVQGAKDKWDAFTSFLQSAWDAASGSFEYFTKTRIIDIIKDAFSWIGSLIDKLFDLQASLGKLNIRERVGNWWDSNVADPVKGWFEGVANGAHSQGPALTDSQKEAYSNMARYGSNTKNINNSGNTTNYINITASGGSPTEIGKAVADNAPSAGYTFDLGYDFPITE